MLIWKHIITQVHNEIQGKLEHVLFTSLYSKIVDMIGNKNSILMSYVECPFTGVMIQYDTCI